jgi:hypothetical protein
MNLTTSLVDIFENLFFIRGNRFDFMNVLVLGPRSHTLKSIELN